MKARSHAAVIAALLAVAVPAIAQQPDQPPRPRRAEHADSLRPRVLNVEAAIRFKQELKLTDAQVAQLETVRKEIVAERQAQARDMIETQSRLMAGLVSREEVHTQFESKRDALRQSMEQRRDRVARILSAEQQEQLLRETRHFMMDRMHERHGRMRPLMHRREHWGPGMMGPRFRSFGR